MSNTNEVVLAPEHCAVSKYASEETFDQVSSSLNWLPIIRLFSGATGLCKEGKFPVNHYGLVLTKDNIVDLGEECDCLPINWRPKAMVFSQEGGAPISFFNPKSAEFKSVEEKSEIQNSGA